MSLPRKPAPFTPTETRDPQIWFASFLKVQIDKSPQTGPGTWSDRTASSEPFCPAGNNQLTIND